MAFRAALELIEVKPLLGEVWFKGGTVAVFLESLEEPPSMFSGGGLTFWPDPERKKMSKFY